MIRPTDDAELLARCRRGDAAAMRDLWLAYKDRVYSIALHFMKGDRTLAEDITQDVFVKLFTRPDRFEAHARFTTWLYRLVANACFDELRRRARWSLLGEVGDTLPVMWRDHAPGPGDRLEASERAAAVRRALAQLSPKLRIAVLMRYYDELSYEQMADALECSMGTVASRLSRAHAELARRLGDWRPSAGALS